MAQDDRHSSLPESMPPQIDDIDASWDDDQPLDESGEIVAAHAFDGEHDDSRDRVTAIPSLPPEDFAAELMAAADAAELGAPPALERAVRVAQPDDGVPTLPSAPPPAQPLAGPARKLSEHSLPTHGERRDSSGAHRFAGPDAPTAPPPRARQAPRMPSQDDLMLELDESHSPPDFGSAGGEPPDQVELPELELDISDANADTDSDTSLADMKDRYAMGDFTGALVIAESILETSPQHIEATRYAESCREVLTQMYAARLGQLTQIPSVATPNDQIRWLSLDHRAGFLLSLVDGASSIEEILDISGMTRLDALRIMFTLLEQRVISLEPGG